MDGYLNSTIDPRASFPDEHLFTYTPFTIPGIDFEFVNRERRVGKKDNEKIVRDWHFHTSVASDVHWGTGSCHAKIFYLFQLLTSEQNLHCLGDMVDLERLGFKDHWNYPDAHVDGLAQILRKTVTENVKYLPGNHDELVRAFLHRMNGKFFGVTVAEEFEFLDALNKLMHAVHSDRHDDIAFGKHKNRVYHIGANLYDFGIEFDAFLHQFPFLKGIKVTPWSKRKLKWIINKSGRAELIEKEVDANPRVTGIVIGHDHTPDMRLTANGKLVLNPGSSTEDGAQSIHQDYNGKFIRINWYEDRLFITDFNGATAERTYKELGLDYHAWPLSMDAHYLDNPARRTDSWPPASIHDGHLEDAKRLLGIIYRLAPPLERREAASMVL